MSTRLQKQEAPNQQSILGMTPSQLAARIKPTETYLPEERETYLRLSHGNETVAVSTNQKGIAQRLVRHPAFEVTQVNGSDVCDCTPTPSLSRSFDPIVRVEGQLPVTHLKVLKNGREQSTLSHIVTDEVY